LQHIQVIDRQALTLLVGPVRARLRSAARSALYLLYLNLLGIGFWTQLVAFFTDRISAAIARPWVFPWAIIGIAAPLIAIHHVCYKWSVY